MRIGFFGDGPWAIQTLRALLDLPDVVIVFVVGRWPTPDEELRDLAAEHNKPFFADQDVNSRVFLRTLGAFEAGLFVSVSYNQIFRRAALMVPEMGAINCHAGKLPFYRGRNVLNWALINDEKEFGITVHYVDEGIDTGDIILQEVFPISENDDYQALLDRAYGGCAVAVRKAVGQILSGSVIRTKQSDIHPTGFYCSGRGEGDEFIDWNLTSREVFNFVRALRGPGPGARSSLRGGEVTVHRVQLVDEAPSYVGIPGAVLSVCEESLTVKTGDSFVKVLHWDSREPIRVGDRLQ